MTTLKWIINTNWIWVHSRKIFQLTYFICWRLEPPGPMIASTYCSKNEWALNRITCMYKNWAHTSFGMVTCCVCLATVGCWLSNWGGWGNPPNWSIQQYALGNNQCFNYRGIPAVFWGIVGGAPIPCCWSYPTGAGGGAWLYPTDGGAGGPPVAPPPKPPPPCNKRANWSDIVVSILWYEILLTFPGVLELESLLWGEGC